MEICLHISNTPLFGNELELIKIKGLNHSTDTFRFDFLVFFFFLMFILKIRGHQLIFMAVRFETYQTGNGL